MKDLNAKPETIKLLEENIANMLFDISLSNIFWICPFCQGKKKMGLHQTQNLL